MSKSAVPRYFKRILAAGIVLACAGFAFGLNEGSSFAEAGIEKINLELRIDEKLMDVLVRVESSNNPLSHQKRTGARGLAQITPRAWKDLTRHFPAKYANLNYRKHIFLPEVGREAGKDYLLILKQYLKLQGIPVTLDNLMAAYNWGIRNLSKYGLAGAPLETKAYINKIKIILENQALPACNNWYGMAKGGF